MVRTGIRGAVIAVVLLLAAALSPAAWGTFPGRDGRIAGAEVSISASGAEKEIITTMEPDGSDVRYLTSAGAHAWSPSWSADGKRIVYVRAGSDYQYIYVMRGNGSRVRRLSSNPNWRDASPAFSPSGRRIVFSRIFLGTDPRKPPSEIVVMRLRDLRMRVLTADGIDPQWSPDGKRIAFTDETLDTGEDISTIRTDGTHKHRLTDAASTPYSYFGPAYTADGHTIYFERTPMVRGYREALMKISASGGPAYPVRVPTPDGLLQGPAPAPEGGCVAGESQRTPNHYALYALGEACPTRGWINSPGGGSSWQALPIVR